MHSAVQHAHCPNETAVLTKALVKATELMGLNKSTVAQVIGTSPATVGRMFNGRYLLNNKNKEWDLALLVVRLYRSLDAITGGDTASMQSWLLSDNRDLQARPIELIKQTAGLVHTLDYVDSYRAKI